MRGRRAIYSLEHRTSERGGWYIYVWHRPPGELRRRRFGRPLRKYFERLGLTLARNLNDRSCMRVVEIVRAEVAGEELRPPRHLLRTTP